LNFSIDKITLLAIAIPMVALLLVGYISYENTLQFIQRDSLADRLDLINQKLEHLVSTITDAETGQRGFIITNRPDYLEPYNSAVKDIDKQLGNLNMLLNSEPLNQQISLNEMNVLKGLIEGKMAELNQTITLRQSHGLNAALPMILSDRGKVLMDKIRTITTDIQSRLRNALSNATTKTQDYAQAMTRIIVITALVAAGISGASVFAIGRSIYKRHLAIQRSLETEVKKRTIELQTANNQLLMANEQLKLHDRMQEEFINVAAHELRTPAQSILGYAELAMTDPSLEIKSSIDAIYRNAFRIQKLTKDILDVTRIESHRLTLNKINFDLVQIILHVVEDGKLKLVSEGRNKVILEFKNEMKAGEGVGHSDEIFVRADKYRIIQVISNLLDNALKFTSEGVISIAVAKRKGEEEMAVVSIQDTGSGIDPEIFPRLFTKFSSKSFNGTGLGLYISKNIIEAHGGKIWAQNNDQERCGATFYFSLPLAV
jgi:signal transduction histidine kinase